MRKNPSLDYEKKSIAAELGVAAFIVPAQMFLKFGIATTALVGSALLLGGQITVITFFMFLLVVSRLYEPMAGTLINLGALNSAQVNIDRTNAMNDIKKQEGKQDFKPERFDIEFKNVGFEYNDDETVLSDVSFTAKQGEVTALIGPSGGGKTTVSRLAARFWDVTKGRITFGGEDIATIDPEALLKYYSIVFQDVTLFNNTITENIRIGKKDATDEEVMNAARLANCDEFISRLPDGYNTIIGENGAKLSGGERQRISIARAFLKDAPVILLDEATASLDAENETLIQQSLSRLIKNKTVMIIAHRMRTIAEADKIVVIKDGKSDEQGKPEELKQQNQIFRKKAMSLCYRGKEIFKPLNTGRIDDRVACVREWIANIFFYTKNGTTIMIDAGYNYDRLKEKLGWLDIDPSDIKHILITHQDTDHVGAVEVDSDGLFKSATLYLSEIENQYLTGEKRRKVIFGLYKLPMVKTDNKRVL